MYVTIVKVWVKPEYLDGFIAATKKNHEASILEDDNLRFDVLQIADTPEQFVLYEAYASPEAAMAHKQTPHYLAWRETVAGWMAQPREGTVCRGLFPHGNGHG